MGTERLTNLEQLLDRMDEAGEATADDDGEPVTLESIIEAVGKRSFGPLLLMAGLIAASPLSGIPGMPTAMGVLILLVAGQMLIGRSCIWLPQWLLRRSFTRGRLAKALKYLRPVARFIDKLVRPRLTVLTDAAGGYVIAALCVLVAATMPPLELVPFAATMAGAVVAVFGLAMIAHDGVLAMLGIALLFGTIVFALSFF